MAQGDATIEDVDLSAVTLSSELFSASITYDALNRPVTQTDPGANITSHIYDESGALKTVMLNGAAYVQDIHYDAKGQREAIWYGNGTKTGYTYDTQTFRLRRLLTVNVDVASANYNQVLQDLYYYYDPVGNITMIKNALDEPVYYRLSEIVDEIHLENVKEKQGLISYFIRNSFDVKKFSVKEFLDFDKSLA